MFDIKISGGSILDGRGAPAFKGDIGITGDTISDIGNLSAAEARQTIDATGLTVCPGFIDVHSHSDAYLLVEPSALSKTFQGITTEVVGNCGASAAPRTGANQMPSDWREKKYPGKWNSVAEYRTLLEQVKPAPNVFLLIGHNTLRSGVSGYVNRPLNQDEMRAMTTLLEKSLDEGGRGLSTGLIYSPGMFAPQAEVEQLAAVVARHNGIYTSHMRSESKDLLNSIKETIAIGEASGIRVEISHLKTSGRPNWGLIDGALELIRAARAKGLPVCADRYPYTAAGTDLDVILPDWAQEGGREVILNRLRSRDGRARLREELLRIKSADYWATVAIGSTTHPDNTRFRGMRLTGIAAELKIQPVDAALHLIETDELKTQAFFFGMSEENMARILAEPYVMIGSDASLRATTGPLSLDFPHPRAYGSFPKVLRMSLDGATVPLPEAIRKMTSLPAAQFGLADRGQICKGMKADITVFDPSTVKDLSSYANPHQLSEGIIHVLVNGTPVIADRALTGIRTGRFL